MNPKIIIMSRNDIENFCDNPIIQKTALISITDFGYDYATIKNKPDYILQVSFDDIDNDVFEDELGRKPLDAEKVLIESKYHMLSDEQAKQISDFYKKVCNDVEMIICQCELGQSRSAAVTAAFLEYREKSGISIFADDNYFPNKVVFRKILDCLNKD